MAVALSSSYKSSLIGQRSDSALIQHTSGCVLKEWSQNSLWLCQGLAFTLQSYKSIEALEGRTHCKCVWRGRYGKCNYPEKEITRQGFFLFATFFFFFFPFPLLVESCTPGTDRKNHLEHFINLTNWSSKSTGNFVTDRITKTQMCDTLVFFSLFSNATIRKKPTYL